MIFSKSLSSCPLSWMQRLAFVLSFGILGFQMLPGGARLPSLLLGLIGIWAVKTKHLDLDHPPVRRITWLLLGLAFLVAASAVSSFDQKSSWIYSIGIACFCLVAYGILYGLKPPGALHWLDRGLQWLFAFLLCDAIVQFSLGVDLFGVPYDPSFEEGRLLGPFKDNLHLSLFLAILAPISLWHWSRAHPWLGLAVFTLTGWIVMLSGARSALVLLALGGVPLFWRLDRRHKFLFLASLMASLAAAYTTNTLVQKKVSQTITPLVQLSSESPEIWFTTLDSMLTYRLTIWETAGRMVLDRPFFGVGAKAFGTAYPHYSHRPEDPFRDPSTPVYHAHNMYVAITAEMGLVGLAGFLTGIGVMIRWYHRASSAGRRAAQPYAAALGALAFPFQSQPVLLTVWWFPVVLLLVCAYLRALDIGEKPA
ncbi:O-antigen ligase [Tepidiphilus sp. J10]|uniref:O-antigen ligase family protein n=1 Tax=Tepidiphilus sp. J10 TaxID=2502185 RepID=UPI00163DCAE4|nr:O-antigen ligase family protein [Tepidiphilus sp. J10]